YRGALVRRDEFKRQRAVVRVRLANEAVLYLASPDVRLLVPVKTHFDGTPAELDKRQAYVRAAFDHHYRRQAEAEQEAENQKRGDHNPVFLEAKPIAGGVDIKERNGREPPRLLPDWMPMCSLSDAYSHDDGWKGNLEDTIAAGAEIQSDNDVIIGGIKAERPF